MPILPAAGSPYTPISTVIELARVRANDAGLSIDGELLADGQPYLSRMVNGAWKWLQARAATAGVETYIREAIITGVPYASEWGNQMFMNWEGCGEVGGGEQDSPALPADLIMPLSVWVQTSNYPYCEMQQASDGLPVCPRPDVYDWRMDGMYFYGYQNAVTNLRIRYSAAFQDFDLEQDPPIPMLYAEDCLAWRIVFEFANARGGTQAASVAQMAEDAFQTLAQRTSRKNQRRSLRRQPYGGSAYGYIY